MILRLKIILSIVSYERKNIIFYEKNSKLAKNNTFLSAVHRKLALSVSFCVRKVDFPALVR